MTGGIFTDASIGVLLGCSVVTCYAYQFIPGQLERLRGALLRGQADSPGVADLVTSAVFTMFIRWCGVDHLAVACILFANHHGELGEEKMFGWALACSGLAVATISTLSAAAAYRERLGVEHDD